MNKRYLKTPEAAEYLSLSDATLTKDRWSRLLGIPFIRAGRAILYDRDDLDQWLRNNKVNPVKCDSSEKRASE